jgi:hypothetical protein
MVMREMSAWHMMDWRRVSRQWSFAYGAGLAKYDGGLDLSSREKGQRKTENGKVEASYRYGI